MSNIMHFLRWHFNFGGTKYQAHRAHGIVADMTNISLLLTIILLVFGVMGVTLFSQYVPEQFGSLQVREQ